MSSPAITSRGVMEGQGAYNRHARLPAGGAALALPLLEKAVQRVGVEAGDQPVLLADYGSSQGRNSLAPMEIAIQGLWRRLGPDRPVSVIHIDQASNDFNTLFAVLSADPARYTLSDPNVFPGAVGRSFYESVLPPGSVHLGWSSYAAVWLSRVPALIPGHFMPLRATGTARAEFARQAAQDWELFLRLRARELRPGGRLVVVLPAVADDGLSGFEDIFDQANAVLAEMVVEGTIGVKERERMVLHAYPRQKLELFAPFAPNGFQGLTVEDFEMSALPDPFWADYERDGDTEALAAKQASFFRAVFVPTLAAALERVRAGDANAHRTFGDRLEAGLKQRLASHPAPTHSFVQTLVLAKGI